PLALDVRHSLDMIQCMRAEVAHGSENSFPLIQGAEVAREDDRHGYAVGRVAKCGKQSEFVWCPLDELAVESKEFSGSSHGMDEDATEDRTDGMESELERRRNAKVPAAASDAPEQIRILLFARTGDAPIRRDEIDREEVVAGQALLPGEETGSAPQGQSGDAGGGDDSAGRRQPDALRRRIEFAPCNSSADDRGASLRVDSDVFHQRQIDDEAVVAHRVSRHIVSTASDGQGESMVPREADRLDPVVR